jgi:drug/metabolite transporter (DMT)-like permease
VRKAYAYTLLAVVFWSSGPVGSKAALVASGDGPPLSPVQVAFWAIGIGWLALLATLTVRGRLGRLRAVSGRGWAVLVAMGLFGWAGYPVAINYAYTRLPLPDALMISYLNPVFVVVFQGARFGRAVRLISGWEQRPEVAARRRPGRVVVGLLLCLLGVAVIATQGRLTGLGGSRSIAGALAAVFAGAAWGVYSNLGRFVSVRPGRDSRGLSDLHNLVAMAGGLAVMGVGLAVTGGLGLPSSYVTALYLGRWGPAQVGAWVPITVMATLNYALGYTLWLYALEAGGRVGEAHKLPALTYLVLVIAIALGWLILRESFGPAFWEGAALIAAGNVVNLWPDSRRPER